MDFKQSSSININGKSFTGNNVSIINGKVFVDGVEQTGEFAQEQTINVTVNADINNLKTVSGNVTVTGNVTTANTVSGDLTVTGSVHGDVHSVSGDVSCGAISGNVKTVSGDIKK